VAKGKFLFLGEEKFWLKGVTYGTFRPGADGVPFPPPAQVEAEFAAIAASGFNTVRTYTPPPSWLLDCAQRHNLRLMIGLPWEQHIAFLDEPGRADEIVAGVAKAARQYAGHPALLCFAVGNEIPAPIVRWLGRGRVERFVRRLYDAVKREDPGALVTYVNYPTTEYLQLPFLDLLCFNVYLETREKLDAYLARLQNLAGERPLVLAEIGLDSQRNGAEAQAKSLTWQIESCFAAGCAGAVVFGWTDEWYRGGHDIEDWDFGLVTRDRRPKPALAAVRKAFAEVPFRRGIQWPRISVVVCSYNGSRTIRDTFEAMKRVEYPNYEVIVVNDGSKDATPDIAREYDVHLISTENRGLSAARNTGWQEATGEIVAYIDDDAYPDPHWLTYLAHVFMTTDHVGVGGPNIAPPGDGPIADCVANAPGGPVQVLLTDTLAEHIPGCNMAFRREALAAIDGFDVRYRTAGDDVDLCWRLMDNGGTIGFHAGAMDWHHRRNSLRMYWRQQKGYGKAEALLEEKWPERYNALGHLSWRGRPYGRGFAEALRLGRAHVYQGSLGSAAYQSLYERTPGTLLQLSLMPDWYLLVAIFALLSLLGIFWTPLATIAWPLFAIAAALPVAQAIVAARRATFPQPTTGKYVLTFVMHLMQPAARLIGRLEHGLSPWRHRGQAPEASALPEQTTIWSEAWREPHAWPETLETVLKRKGATVTRGSDYDDWDLKVRGGAFGSMRCLLAPEEHGAGKQLVRVRLSPTVPKPVTVAGLTLLVLSALALLDDAPVASIGLLLIAAALGFFSLRDLQFAAGLCRSALTELGAKWRT
jgi:GT2 family glycosyltransferase